VQRTADLYATAREVVAVFEHEDELHRVVEELQTAGFDRADISVLAPWKVVARKIGRKLQTVAEVQDRPDVPRAILVDRGSLGLAQGVLVAGPLYVASSGATIAFAASGADLPTIAMAGIAAGAMGAALGILPAIWVRRRHRRQMRDLLDRGGLVLWVRISNKNREKLAKTILDRHRAHDVHLHSIAA
jgi:hypothetical protein